MRRWWLPALAGLMLLASCSSASKTDSKRALTERERDSLISRSVLPGAAVVGRAMAVSDAAAAKAEQPPPEETTGEH